MSTNPESLEDIWRRRSAADAFPSTLLTSITDAACFFCAAFYGANDVIYLHRAGVRDLVLVDTDAHKLAAMAALYPGVQKTFADNAFVVAERMRSEGTQFDLVVTDPFTSLTARTIGPEFSSFASITRKMWVAGICGKDLAALDVRPETDSIQRWLDSSGRDAFAATWLGVRNPTHADGVYWLALRRR